MAQQLTLSVRNRSILTSLRKVLSLMDGVTIVETHSLTKKRSAYEQSMDDLQNGRVTVYDNAEDFYKELGI